MILTIYILILFSTILDHYKVNNSEIGLSKIYLFASNKSLIKPIFSKYTNESNISFIHSVLKDNKLSTKFLTNLTIFHNKMHTIETKRETIEIKSLLERDLKEAIDNDRSRSNESNIYNYLKENSLQDDAININNSIRNLNKTLNVDEFNNKNLSGFFYSDYLKNSLFNLENNTKFSNFSAHINFSNNLENSISLNYSNLYLNQTPSISFTNNTFKNYFINREKLYHNHTTSSQSHQYSTKEIAKFKQSSDFQHTSNRSLKVYSNYQHEFNKTFYQTGNKTNKQRLKPAPNSSDAYFLNKFASPYDPFLPLLSIGINLVNFTN